MRIARCLSVVGLLAASCATGPRVPPSMPAVARLQPPVAPEPLPASDPSVLAILRVKNPIRVLQLLGVGADRLAAMFPGFDARDVHGGTAAIFLFEPLPGKGNVPGMVAFLPVAATAPVARRLHAAFSIEPMGPDSIWSNDPAVLSERMKQAGHLQELAQAPMEEDISLQLNVASVVTRYRQPFHEILQRAEAAQAASSKDEPVDSRKTLQLFLDAIEQVQAARLGVSILPDAFLFSLVSRDKSAPANAYEEVDVSPELIRFLPAGHLRMQASGRFQQKNLALTQGFFEALKGTDPKVVALINQSMAEQVKLGADMQSAFAMSVSATNVIHVVGLMQTSNAAALLELTNRTSRLMQEDPEIRAAMKKGGADCNTSVERGVRIIEGWPVDRSRTDCRLRISGASANAQKLLSKLYPLTTESVRVGNYLITDINGTPEELQQIVRQLLEGTPTGRPLAAVAAFPERGSLHADLDVASLVREIDALMPQQPGEPRLPALDPALPPVVLTVYESGATTEYRGRISRSVLAALGEVFQQLKPATSQPAAQRRH